MKNITEFSFTLPEDLLEALGIDEDSMFEAYFEDGRVRIRLLDEEDIKDSTDQECEVNEEDLALPEKCVCCPNFCWHCKKCTIDFLGE